MERHSDRLKPIATSIETKNNNYLVLHLTFVRWPFLCTGVRKEIILFLFLAVQSHSTDCERRENYYFSSDCRNALECVHCASGNYLIVALNKVAAAKKSNIFNWNYFNIFANTAQPARYRGCCCCHSFLRWPPFFVNIVSFCFSSSAIFWFRCAASRMKRRCTWESREQKIIPNPTNGKRMITMNGALLTPRCEGEWKNELNGIITTDIVSFFVAQAWVRKLRMGRSVCEVRSERWN